MNSTSRGRVYLVSCVDTRGETFTRVYRQRTAALNYMAALEECGGSPVLYRGEVDWIPDGEG